MTLAMLGRDIFVRHTATNGVAYVQQHRTWDADRFIIARQLEAEKMNAEVKDGGKRLAKAEQITEEQFRRERSR